MGEMAVMTQPELFRFQQQPDKIGRLFLTPLEVSEICNKTYAQINYDITMYRLDAIKVAQYWRIPAHAINRYLQDYDAAKRAWLAWNDYLAYRESLRPESIPPRRRPVVEDCPRQDIDWFDLNDLPIPSILFGANLAWMLSIPMPVLSGDSGWRSSDQISREEALDYLVSRESLNIAVIEKEECRDDDDAFLQLDLFGEE